MLTKTDLNQIRNVVKGEIKPVREDIKKLTRRTKSLEINTIKIKKDLKTTIDFFDNEHLETKQRLKQIEQHMGLSTI